MKLPLLLLALCLPHVAHAQQLWPATVRLTGNPAPAVDVSTLTQDTFFTVDATAGFGGFVLPDPARVGTRYFGAVKRDHTSNPIQFFVVQPGADVAGFNYLALTIVGDALTIGCDGQGYFIVSDGRAVKQLFDQHRTARVSAGQTPYQMRETDRHALVRVVADTGVGIVLLPTLGNFVAPNGYRNTFTVAVERTANSTFPVRVCVPPTKSLDNVYEGCMELTRPRELVWFDYDSAEWIVISRHPSPEPQR